MAAAHRQYESVKALAVAVAGTGDLPDLYIRPDMNLGMAADGDICGPPVIDMMRLLDPLLAGEETAKLGSACRRWGIFQLINHGIDEEVIRSFKSVVKGFFDLPAHEKKEVAIKPEVARFEGFGQHWIFSEEQKRDWVDLFFLTTLPRESRLMSYWPRNPPAFKDSVDAYSVEANKLATRLLKCIADDLGIQRQELLNELFKDSPNQAMRFNYYPPCPAPGKVMGMSAHTDRAGVITVVLHANDVPGLQILKDGRWILVHPVPGAVVVNVGDILQIVSNGTYKSVVHRAVLLPGAPSERITVAAFIRPHGGCTVGPLAGGRPLYKSMVYKEYLNAFSLLKELSAKTLLEMMKFDVDDGQPPASNGH